MARPVRSFLAVLALGLAAPALGQQVASRGEGWSFAAAAYGYFVPEDDDFLVPVVTADRGKLHLEARWQYEAPDTGSAWVGVNFSGGAELEWEVTPIVGLVFGDVDGLAPGYKGALTWKSLELYSEGEYVFDFAGSEGSFFYNWSELTVSPAEWVRLGFATQRTRAYESDRDLQRGLMAGFSFGSATATVYVMNPDDEPTVIVSLAMEF
ncbi:MAG: hypothetical protein IPL90_03645 [Holophagales bacterium]|nr:hypothetical protein [Holophagales bacterium]